MHFQWIKNNLILQAEVDEALSNALSRACTLEGRLRTASQAYTKLGEVKNDAQVAASMVDKTAALAKDVSAKVRQLDLARVRQIYRIMTNFRTLIFFLNSKINALISLLKMFTLNFLYFSPVWLNAKEEFMIL